MATKAKRPAEVAVFLRKFEVKDRAEVVNSLLSLGLRYYQQLTNGSSDMAQLQITADRSRRSSASFFSGVDGPHRYGQGQAHQLRSGSAQQRQTRAASARTRGGTRDHREEEPLSSVQPDLTQFLNEKRAALRRNPNKDATEIREWRSNRSRPKDLSENDDQEEIEPRVVVHTFKNSPSKNIASSRNQSRQAVEQKDNFPTRGKKVGQYSPYNPLYQRSTAASNGVREEPPAQNAHRHNSHQHHAPAEEGNNNDDGDYDVERVEEHDPVQQGSPPKTADINGHARNHDEEGMSSYFAELGVSATPSTAMEADKLAALAPSSHTHVQAGSSALRPPQVRRPSGSGLSFPYPSKVHDQAQEGEERLSSQREVQESSEEKDEVDEDVSALCAVWDFACGDEEGSPASHAMTGGNTNGAVSHETSMQISSAFLDTVEATIRDTAGARLSPDRLANLHPQYRENFFHDSFPKLYRSMITHYHCNAAY